MLQKLLNQSLTKVSLCSIVSVVLFSNCVINSAVMFNQQAIAQTTTNIGVQGQNQQQHQSQNQTGQIISNKILEVRLLADTLGNRLNKSAAVLQLTSKLPQVTNVSSANLISHALHGIPSNADLPKRSVAKEILASDSDIPVVFFNMPNGNFYLEEPYFHQKNLTIDNAASREFFKGAVETHGMFLSGIFVSDSSGQREAAITVPIYSTNGSLVGIWGGALALDGFNKSLQTLNLTNNERILYIDQHGQKVSDSDKQLSNKIESFANLQSFKNAITGKLGSNLETVNGTRMFVAYSPVRIDSTTWVVLLLHPAGDNGKGT